MGHEISNVNGASSVQVKTQQAEVSASAVGIQQLLPPPSPIQDPMAALEELMVKMKLNDKQLSREAKQLAEQSIQQAVDELVKDMSDKADAQMWAGIAGGLGQVASGGLQVGGALADGQASTDIGKGRGDTASGLGSALSATYQAAATGIDGEIVAGNARLSAGERDASAAQASEQEASQGLRELLARIDRIRQTEQGAQRAALFRA